MGREFFGKDEVEAVEKAAIRLQCKAIAIKYKLLKKEIVKSNNNQVVILVDDEEILKEKVSLQKEKRQSDKDTFQRPLEKIMNFINVVLGYLKIEPEINVRELENETIIYVGEKNSDGKKRRKKIDKLEEALQTVIGKLVTEKSEKKIKVFFGNNRQEEVNIEIMAKNIEKIMTKIKGTIHVRMIDSDIRRAVHEKIKFNKDIQTESIGGKKYRILKVKKRNEKSI